MDENYQLEKIVGWKKKRRLEKHFVGWQNYFCQLWKNGRLAKQNVGWNKNVGWKEICRLKKIIFCRLGRKKMLENVFVDSGKENVGWKKIVG